MKKKNLTLAFLLLSLLAVPVSAVQILEYSLDCGENSLAWRGSFEYSAAEALGSLRITPIEGKILELSIDLSDYPGMGNVPGRLEPDGSWLLDWRVPLGDPVTEAPVIFAALEGDLFEFHWEAISVPGDDRYSSDFGPSSCDMAPAETSSWSQFKALYR
ncbi:MAG: hypothetical protein QF492_08390 [Candidatus Krumholzibacteria bacterium]|nr:hypothetical protein [Candidatus Krumholzibacteria bacterium]MDP6669906.1 hypothetical protein [Candidatus Krumholzibacteria bacterium]MDP6797935.1 hypothetical protein [Candidatus Krumholzibacteria bacterium]MDP7021107.1 hypothetical protein [Candidatus Krumholzibacteria bacterium]